MSPDNIRIKLGCRFNLRLPPPTPMIAPLNVHFSRVGNLEYPDHVKTWPPVPLSAYRDGFGNWCTRRAAPQGEFSIGTEGGGDIGMPPPYAPGHPADGTGVETAGGDFPLKNRAAASGTGEPVCVQPHLSPVSVSVCLLELTEPGCRIAAHSIDHRRSHHGQ